MDSASTDPFILFSSFVRGLIPSGSCLGLDDGKSFFHGVCTLDFDVRRWWAVCGRIATASYSIDPHPSNSYMLDNRDTSSSSKKLKTSGTGFAWSSSEAVSDSV
jgi:hypothetical protein